MHSNELQTGYREYHGAGRKTGTGDAELADGIKTNAKDTMSVTRRRTGSAMKERRAGGCKGEEDDDIYKRYEGSECAIKARNGRNKDGDRAG